MEKSNEAHLLQGVTLEFFQEHKDQITKSLQREWKNYHPKLDEMIQEVLQRVEQLIPGLCKYIGAQGEFVDIEMYISELTFYINKACENVITSTLFCIEKKDECQEAKESYAPSLHPVSKILSKMRIGVQMSAKRKVFENMQMDFQGIRVLHPLRRKSRMFVNKLKDLGPIYEVKFVDFLTKRGFSSYTANISHETEKTSLLKHLVELHLPLSKYVQPERKKVSAYFDGHKHSLVYPRDFDDACSKSFSQLASSIYRLKLSEYFGDIFCQPRVDIDHFQENPKEEEAEREKNKRMKEVLQRMDFAYDGIFDIWALDYFIEDFPSMIIDYYNSFIERLQRSTFSHIVRDIDFQREIAFFIAALQRYFLHNRKMEPPEDTSNKRSLAQIYADRKEHTEEKKTYLSYLTDLLESIFQYINVPPTCYNIPQVAEAQRVYKRIFDLSQVLFFIPTITLPTNGIYEFPYQETGSEKRLPLRTKDDAYKLLETLVQDVFDVFAWGKPNLIQKSDVVRDPQKQSPVEIGQWPDNPVLLWKEDEEEKDDILFVDEIYMWSIGG